MSKYFISAEEGWRDLEEVTRLTVESFDLLSGTITYRMGEYTFTVPFKPIGRNWLSLKQELGICKPRRTTYKTVKRDCAKRNRR